jgi:predicted RNA-binding protein with PUA-like domain
LISLQDLKTYPELSEMKILQRGNRLSITPLSKNEWDFINKIPKESS